MAASGMLAVYASPSASALETLHLSVPELFSAVFDTSTLLTGLLFSVYVLAVAPGGGFIERIFTTRTFDMFRRYVIEAMILGALASAVSMPLRALEQITVPFSVNFLLVVCIWGFFSVAAGLSFLRVAHVFFVFAQAGNGHRRAA
ncbi:hypothetical protein ACSMXM_10935 [Pacificimonas sp. ICDLI1SI03]